MSHKILETGRIFWNDYITDYITVCFLCSEIASETSGFGLNKGQGVGGGGVNGLSGLGTSISPLSAWQLGIMKKNEERRPVPAKDIENKGNKKTYGRNVFPSHIS